MSLSEAIVTCAGPTRSARGTGSFQPTVAAARSTGRLQRASIVASPESGCASGITMVPPVVATAATSTMLAGPTSSMLQPSSPTTTRDTGAPRTTTRRVARSEMRVAPIS